VVTASLDRTAQVWDFESGVAVTPPFHHDNTVRAAGFIDNSTLFTLSHGKSGWEVNTETGEPVPPALGHTGAPAPLAADAGIVTALVWPLPTEKHDTDDLTNLAQLLAAGRLDDTTASREPISCAMLKGLWEKLKVKYPDDLSPDFRPETTRAWHEHEADASERTREGSTAQWFAARWHLDHLLTGVKDLKPAERVQFLERRGRTSFSLGDWAAAVEDYTAAIEVDPKLNWRLLAERGQAYNGLHEWAKADQDCSNYLKMDPDNRGVRTLRARINMNLGQWQKVVEDDTYLLGSGKLSPTLSAQVLAQRGQAYLELSATKAGAEKVAAAKDAAAEFQKLAEVTPWDPSVGHREALALLAAGDQEAYQMLCRERLKAAESASNPVTRNSLIWTCVIGPIPEADAVRVVELAKKLVESSEAKNYHYLNTLGAAYYRAGKWQEAIDTLKAAEKVYAEQVRGTPLATDMTANQGMVLSADGTPWDWYFLAMALHRQGNDKEAKEMLARADRWVEKNAPRQGEKPAASWISWTQRWELWLLHDEAQVVVKPKP
jgi:tetratricopeptide (TPR) repeat protein